MYHVKLGEKPGSILERVRQLKTRMIWDSKRWVYEWALSGKNHRNSALESLGDWETNSSGGTTEAVP